jgi:hypothetical protein
MWHQYDVMECTNRKGKCIAKIIISAIITGIAIWLLYKAFGVSDNNLGEYIVNRRV